MNIFQLRTFVEIANVGSISKVAEISNISQSAVSQQIKSMEQKLDVPLFLRNHMGVSLTQYGLIVYEYALDMIKLYDNMEKSLEEKRSGSQIVRILATPVAYSYVIPCSIFTLKQKFPNFILKVESNSSFDSEEAILNNKADMAFICGKPHSEDLICQEAFVDNIYLVSSYDFDASKLKSIHDIYDIPLIMLSDSQKTRQELDSFLKKSKIDLEKLNILYELNSIESIKLSATQGHGLVFLPYAAIKKELYNKQLKIINLSDFDFTNECFLIRKPNLSSFTNQHKELMAFFEKNLQKTIC